VENASNEVVMGAERELCEFNLLVNLQNHSNLSLKELDDALKRNYGKMGIFREQKMLKSAKTNVDDLLARVSHQLHEQKIHKIHAAMEALVYGAEKVFTTILRQFQVRLNRARRVATSWSDVDRQKAIERLEQEIHHVRPANLNGFDKVFKFHVRQLSQEVGTKATGPRTKFAKALALMTTATKEAAQGVATMTAYKRLQFQIRRSNAATEATSWSLADMERVTAQLEREIYGIILNEQKRFKKEFSIRLIEFEPWWASIGIQALRRAIEQGVIHFGHPKMHLVNPISESICPMGSGDNFTTDISAQLQITNVKDAYRCNNKVNYIRQMPRHNERCTGLDYMEETLSYLALQGWYDIDCAKVFNLLSATNKQWST